MVCGSILKPHDFPAIYNFGDSNSATGNFGFQPPPPNAPNRICDGHIIVDYIAEHLKLPLLSAYTDSLQVDFEHGANFAKPGATIRKLNKTDHPSFIYQQIDQFNDLKSRAKMLYNEANNNSEREKLPKQEDFAKALYTFDIGQNDFNSDDILSMSLDQLPLAIADMINQLSSSIHNVYEQGQGGRIFWIHDTGPFGCLPLNVRKYHNASVDECGCVKLLNEIALEFNKQLEQKVIELRSELKGATITYVDIYAAKYGLIRNAKTLGFGDPMDFCCGNKQYPDRVLCGGKATLPNKQIIHGTGCKDPSKYKSWDGIHYTEAANQLVANQIIR